ncbi:hypothetical protein K6V71_16995 [Cupriavidus gilardii]|uniref:hypothetical protein n=1 Tax=Burkholderiales TaxID=80840 RepID=UPI000B413316|nr:hypothetical protein [Pigmentiphaga sp. NML080357]OVZ63782.1 hypothetical protein CDO44_03080 [Pigmentiphaga sp. NML080357]
MNAQFKKAIIDDVTAANVDEALQAHLLDLFEYAMKSVAPTLIREARFDSGDFGTASQHGGEGFAMLLSRAHANSRDAWFGAFQRGDQRLDVVGHLE